MKSCAEASRLGNLNNRWRVILIYLCFYKVSDQHILIPNVLGIPNSLFFYMLAVLIKSGVGHGGNFGMGPVPVPLPKPGPVLVPHPTKRDMKAVILLDTVLDTDGASGRGRYWYPNQVP